MPQNVCTKGSQQGGGALRGALGGHSFCDFARRSGFRGALALALAFARVWKKQRRPRFRGAFNPTEYIIYNTKGPGNSCFPFAPHPVPYRTQVSSASSMLLSAACSCASFISVFAVCNHVAVVSLIDKQQRHNPSALLEFYDTNKCQQRHDLLEFYDAELLLNGLPTPAAGEQKRETSWLLPAPILSRWRKTLETTSWSPPAPA